MTTSYEPTERTRVRRLPERAAYDRATVHAILDEGFICHVGFVVDGQPFAIPTGYARVGETLYLHGSTGSRLGLRPGMPVCVTVTLLDGLVLARAAFHHSFNYRSAMVLGRTRLVTDPEEKDAALRALVEHIVPGRSADVRPGDGKELAATAVLAVPLEEVSAKVRGGDPKDEEEDYSLPVWAGVLPLALVAGSPVPDSRLDPAITAPPHVAAWHRPSPNDGSADHQVTGADGATASPPAHWPRSRPLHP
ncbi:MAG TPA: pyridoxamine 5'-phosphate oxidase family protein [Actinomycetes bacterium]|nr:pyridoxamine 5'-phosphate oxidase family protein [Actinomycetes bacterium]